MPTVIDQLYVLLGLDASGFEKGRKKVGEDFKKTREDAAKSTDVMDEFGKRAGASMTKLRNETLGLFLAFQGASSVQGFVSNMLAGDAAAGRLAKNLGMTTLELSAYGLAIKSVGGDAKEAESAFGMLAKVREDLRLGRTPTNAAEWSLLGFGGRDFDNTATAFAKLAEAAQRMPRTQFYNLAHTLGLTDGVINLLQLGPAKMRELVKAREADAAASQKQSDEAERLQGKWADLQAKITGELRPAVYAFADGLEEVDKQIGLANVAMPVLTGLVGALAVATLAATWEWVLLAGAIGAALAGARAYGDYVAQAHRDNLAKRGASRLEMDGNGSHPAGNYHIHSATGRPIDAETAREINAGGGATAAGGGGAFGRGVANSRWLQENLRAGGLTAEQAQGVAAGIAAEGGSLGMAANGAFGIGQWRGPRLKRLQAQYGKAPTKEQQLAFLLSELKGGDRGGASVMGSRTAEETLSNYIGGTGWGFMRPGNGRAGDMRRGMAQLGKRYMGDGPGGGGSTTNIGSIVVNTRATDGEGIARDLPPAIRRRAMTVQAATGLD